jgi:hypothetical protein
MLQYLYNLLLVEIEDFQLNTTFAAARKLQFKIKVQGTLLRQK